MNNAQLNLILKYNELTVTLIELSLFMYWLGFEPGKVFSITSLSGMASITGLWKLWEEPPLWDKVVGKGCDKQDSELDVSREVLGGWKKYWISEVFSTVPGMNKGVVLDSGGVGVEEDCSCGSSAGGNKGWWRDWLEPDNPGDGIYRGRLDAFCLNKFTGAERKYRDNSLKQMQEKFKLLPEWAPPISVFKICIILNKFRNIN